MIKVSFQIYPCLSIQNILLNAKDPVFYRMPRVGLSIKSLVLNIANFASSKVKKCQRVVDSFDVNTSVLIEHTLHCLKGHFNLC